MPKVDPFQQKWQIRKELPTSQKYAREFMYKRVPLKGKILLLYKHCLYLTMRQKYRTTEFISVRLMYLCHVLHRLSKYFLMSKISQGISAKGPPGLLPRTYFPLPLLFRTPAKKAFREGHRCNLIQSQPYEGAPRAGINAGIPISQFNTMEYRQYRQLTNSPLVANVTSE